MLLSRFDEYIWQARCTNINTDLQAELGERILGMRKTFYLPCAHEYYLHLLTISSISCSNMAYFSICGYWSKAEACKK